MTTYYVSNAAENGAPLANPWGVAGSDSNSGLSRAAPFATIAKATSVATSADDIVVNPTSVAYAENSGSGWLEHGSARLITGDPAIAGSGTAPTQVPVVRAASSTSRVINSAGQTYTQTLACLTLDGQSGSSRSGIIPHASALLILQQVNFRNIAGSGQAVFSFTAGSSLTMDRCSIDSSCTATGLVLLATNMTTVRVLGGSYTPNIDSTKSPVFYFTSSATFGTVQFAADVNGLLPYFGGKGGTLPTTLGGHVGTGGSGYAVSDVLTLSGGTASQTAQVTVTSVDGIGAVTGFNVTRQGNYTDLPAFPAAVTGGTGSGAQVTLFTTPVFSIAVSAGVTVTSFTCAAIFDKVSAAISVGVATVTSWKISGCTVTRLTSAYSFQMVGFTCTSGEFSANQITSYNGDLLAISENAQGCVSKLNSFHRVAGGNRIPAVYWVLGTTFLSYKDAMSIDAGAYGGFVGGSDGVAQEASQIQSTRTGNLAVGDDAARKYISTTWTTNALSASVRATHLAQVTVEGRRIGTGQNITCSLYSDNAGVPGTLVSTSDVLPAATFPSGGDAFINFNFSTPPAITANTRYHLVFTTPAIDAANYVRMTLCGNVQSAGNGHVEYVRYSGDAVSWTSDTAHSFEITLYSGYYAHTPTYLGTSVIYADDLDPLETETINSGPCLNPAILGGRFLNAGYTLHKNAKGGLIAANFQVNGKAKNGLAGFYAKASTGVKIYNNTILVPSGFGILTGPDTLSLNFNHIPVPNFDARNNVIVTVPGGLYTPYPYSIDQANTPGATIDYNCVYLSSGTALDYASGWERVRWQAAGFDVNSLFADPQLANQTASAATADDITPAVTSPVIGRGTDLHTTVGADLLGRPYTPKPSLGAVEFMTGELLAIASGATVLYALVRNASGLVWNGSGFESYRSLNLGAYALGMGQQGSSGVWSGSMPVSGGTRPPRGRYFIDYRIQAGASPAESDTVVTRGKLSVDWDGALEMLPVDPNRILPPPL